LLNSAASVIMPFSDSVLTKMLVETIGVGVVIGVYRLARDRAEARAYAIYALLSSAMLVVWHYPPTARFLFPVFPLLLAGFSYQLAQTVQIIQKAYADPRQRRSAIVFAAVLILIAVPVIRMNWSFLFEIAPAAQLAYRKQRADNMAAARHIRTELPADAKIMSGIDPMLYLLTGRQGMCMMLPANLWYEERLDDMVERERRMPQVARDHGLDYLYVNRAVKGDFTEDVHKKVLRAFDTSAELVPAFKAGQGVLYKVRPAVAGVLSSATSN
jgi:hypothetical protein